LSKRFAEPTLSMTHQAPEADGRAGESVTKGHPDRAASATTVVDGQAITQEIASEEIVESRDMLLSSAPHAVRATPDDGGSSPIDLAAPGDRYELRATIGEGGMGEVFACVDRRIGREVAVKRLRADKAGRPDLRERFVREGRVQGQLEHPAIVPVYDLGQDRDGVAYMTMKRVRGETLEHVLERLHRGATPAVVRRYSRHKLLTAFTSACLAVHYAHTSGVVHRDLKPSNVMLGDFGEVYVLDWGLAKIATEQRAPHAVPGSGRVVDTPDAGQRTEHGAILGTPGYMAPEQCAGDVEAVDARADVYALGAILFELLTLEPLHGHGTASELVRRTKHGSDARASVRAPDRDVEPELDAICVKATAVDPAQRYATALELHDAVEAVLAGYRDVEKRRELAAGHALAAAAATKRALGATHGTEIEETRLAMREISRAVALDPENREALRTLVRLFTHAPARIPREARAELASVHAHSQRVGSRTAAVAYLSVLAYAPLAVWMGVKNLPLGAAYLLLWVAAAGASFVAGRGRRAANVVADVVILVSNVALAVGTAMFGPFVMIPAMASVNTMSFVVSGDRNRRALCIVLGCVSVIAPLVLELAGVLPPSMVFRDGGIFIPPRAFEMPVVPTLVFLALATVGTIVTGSLVVARFRDALVSTEQRLYFHTWLLRQFLPDEAYEDVVPGATNASLTSVPRAAPAAKSPATDGPGSST
jgi:serine/threonine-protein kinase